jgi:hypothetical protein
MSALQIAPILTNKPNLLDGQINVSSIIITNYEQRTMNYEIKNKAKTNPIQTQYKANTNPKQTRFKPKQTQFILSKPLAKQEKIQFQVQNYTVFRQKTLKRSQKSYIKPFIKKLQKFLRIYLHYYAYGDILLHISEDIVLCN